MKVTSIDDLNKSFKKDEKCHEWEIGDPGFDKFLNVPVSTRMNGVGNDSQKNEEQRPISKATGCEWTRCHFPECYGRNGVLQQRQLGL